MKEAGYSHKSNAFPQQHVAGKEELSLGVEHIYLGDRHSATVKQAPQLQ